jgi:predicted RNA-binding Zn-ribbon protein involved in translation (DUF1610 family)
MKELTHDEFQDRLKAFNRAMHIFGELTDNDMTKAFMAYQEIFAERERELFMLPSQAINDLQMERKYEMMPCPECGRELLYRTLLPNDDGFQVQWVCSNPECDTVLNSKDNINWWMDKLKIRKALEDGGTAGVVEGFSKGQQVRRRTRHAVKPDR